MHTNSRHGRAPGTALKSLGCLALVWLMGCTASGSESGHSDAPAPVEVQCRCGDRDVDVLGCGAACRGSSSARCDHADCACAGACAHTPEDGAGNAK